MKDIEKEDTEETVTLDQLHDGSASEVEDMASQILFSYLQEERLSVETSLATIERVEKALNCGERERIEPLREEDANKANITQSEHLENGECSIPLEVEVGSLIKAEP